eukprot:scaffold112815_cov42-Phaeocystis_antarctica.AAC.1
MLCTCAARRSALPSRGCSRSASSHARSASTCRPSCMSAAAQLEWYEAALELSAPRTSASVPEGTAAAAAGWPFSSAMAFV